MIAILANNEHYNSIVQFNVEEELNRRGFWNICRIPESSPFEVNEYVKNYVMDKDIENVIIDIDIYENKMQLVELVKKLKILSGFDLYVIAPNFNRKDVLLKHLIEIGLNTNSIFTGSIESICRLLATNILKDPKKVFLSDSEIKESLTEPEVEVIPVIPDEPIVKTNAKKKYDHHLDSSIQDVVSRMNSKVDSILGDSEKTKIEEKEEKIEKGVATTNPPPSRSFPIEKDKLSLKPENTAPEYTRENVSNIYINKQMATTIGVVGAGRRVGTTTQALQLVLYLKTNGYTAAVVEMNENGHLSSHLNLMPEGQQEKNILDSSHFMINGIDIYRERKSVVEAKNLYQYVVCDYGDGSNSDITSFLERDIKIVVGCIKPYEVNLLNPFFALDDNSTNYIYSFVNRELWNDIRIEMGAAGNRTYFAPYAPDIFRYTGDDQIYGQILKETKLTSLSFVSEAEPKKEGFLKRVLKIKITKEEMNEYPKKREKSPVI